MTGCDNFSHRLSGRVCQSKKANHVHVVEKFLFSFPSPSCGWPVLRLIIYGVPASVFETLPRLHSTEASCCYRVCRGVFCVSPHVWVYLRVCTTSLPRPQIFVCFLFLLLVLCVLPFPPPPCFSPTFLAVLYEGHAPRGGERRWRRRLAWLGSVFCQRSNYGVRSNFL